MFPFHVNLVRRFKRFNHLIDNYEYLNIENKAFNGNNYLFRLLSLYDKFPNL